MITPRCTCTRHELGFPAVNGAIHLALPKPLNHPCPSSPAEAAAIKALQRPAKGPVQAAIDQLPPLEAQPDSASVPPPPGAKPDSASVPPPPPPQPDVPQPAPEQAALAAAHALNAKLAAGGPAGVGSPPPPPAAAPWAAGTAPAPPPAAPGQQQEHKGPSPPPLPVVPGNGSGAQQAQQQRFSPPLPPPAGDMEVDG